MKAAWAAVAVCLAGAPTPAVAGPPYNTNDPAPTDFGHWEIYLFTTGGGSGSAIDDDTGIELNYGPLKDVQVSATLPLSFSHASGSGWRSGTGDVELGAKYRFLNDERAGFSAAIFPKAILPTSSLATLERTRFFFPLWMGKDFAGGTSLFGGGGYMVNPGSGNRDYWTGGVALTHQFGKRLQLGGEVNRQGADTMGGRASTSAAVGAIVDLKGPLRLLASGGPTWSDGGGSSFHAFAALGVDF